MFNKIKSILVYVKPNKLMFSCLVYFLTIGVFLEISNAFIQEVVLDTIYNNEISIFYESIIYSGLIIISSIILMMIGNILKNHFVNVLANNTIENIFFDVNSTEYLYLNNYSSGDIMVRISKNSESFIRIVQTVLFQLTENILLILFSFYYLSTINSVLSILIILSGFVSIIIGRFFDKRVSALTKNINDIKAMLWSKTKEFFLNIESVYSYKLGDSLIINDYSHRENLLKQTNKKDLYTNFLWSSLLALNDGFMIIVSFALCYLAYEEKSYVGSIFAFVNLVGKVQWPFINLSNLINSLYQDIAEAKRVQEIINPNNTTKQLTDQNITNANHSNNTCSNNLFLEVNINNFIINGFRILNSVTIEASKGNIIGIAGRSGSGKSTIGKIISGLYYSEQNIKSVSVKINGQEINTKHYSKVLYIPQSPHMFLTDLRNNILIGNLNSTNQQISEVASIFELDNIRKSKESSLSMQVLENGKNLSGGEIQKIAFARAVLSNADIIIFDEITSNLDSETEREVLLYIKKISKNKVVILISHNEFTLMQTDYVYLIENGNLEDSGSHTYLINNNMKYKELFN